MTATPRSSPAPAAGRSLVSLLGEQRAAIVEELRREGDRSVSELAALLGISEVATRKHLAVLEKERLVSAETVRQGRGRPAARYRLTEDARRLFPAAYDRFASEMLDFLEDERGREGLRSFLRWRLEREVDGLREAVTAEDLHERLDQLADALSDAGFEAVVGEDDDGYTLVQTHCVIEDVAREHPEVCAYEAAAFSKVLGRDVTLSRRQTMAEGADACVCCVAPRRSSPDTSDGPPVGDDTPAGPAAPGRPERPDVRSRGRGGTL